MSWPTKRTGYATAQSYNDDHAKTQRVIVKTSDGGKSWTPMAFGRAVNKIRVVRTDNAVRAFAIGVDVYRIDLAG